MKMSRRNKGSIEDMIYALQDKIDELEGSDTHLMSSKKITGSTSERSESDPKLNYYKKDSTGELFILVSRDGGQIHLRNADTGSWVYPMSESDFEANYSETTPVKSASDPKGFDITIDDIIAAQDYYDYPKYHKEMYLPTISNSKVKLTIGAYTDPHYDDENVFEINTIIDVEDKRTDFILDSSRVYQAVGIRDGHERLTGYYDEDDDILSVIDEIYDFFAELPQDEIDSTLVQLSDDYDANRVAKLFPLSFEANYSETSPVKSASDLSRAEESTEEVIYQFPKFTSEDRSVARRDYNLSIVRETETDTFASGSIEDIRNFADEYLGYQLSEDYFIDECDHSVNDEYDIATI